MAADVMIATVMMTALLGLAPPTSWTTPVLPRATAVADAQWPSSPCKGREVVVFVPNAVVDAETGVEAIADALAEACTVHVSRKAVADSVPSGDTRMSCTGNLCSSAPYDVADRAGWLCTVLEHEFGHLAGLGHSTKPTSVMYYSPRMSAPCKAAFDAR